MTGGGILQRIRQAGLLLALLALVLKASAAPGYMLDGSSGRLIATLCSGQASGIVIDLGGKSGDKHDRSTDDAAPCAFAVAAHAASPPLALTIAPRVETGWISISAGEVRAATIELAAPPPWARGPPLSI